ncbi:MAG: hypothetical protein HOG49_25660 [Candidatus Scalindua sp.]|nr:hypothetical protein [Candidatus Scalindua sp.]
MVGKRKYTTEEVIDALKECHGMQTYAAKKLGCTYKTVWQYIQDFPKIAEALVEIHESSIDTAELKLMAKIKEGDMTAIIFYLKCKGKKRGFIDRPNFVVPLPDGNETQIERAIRILDRAEKGGVDIERINQIRGMITRYNETERTKLVEADVKEVKEK